MLIIVGNAFSADMVAYGYGLICFDYHKGAIGKVGVKIFDIPSNLAVYLTIMISIGCLLYQFFGTGIK
jgi:hypothetical protein